MKVGLIGLGNMGSGIAKTLLRAGHRMTVYNRTRARAEGCGPMARLSPVQPPRPVRRSRHHHAR